MAVEDCVEDNVVESVVVSSDVCVEERVEVAVEDCVEVSVEDCVEVSVEDCVEDSVVESVVVSSDVCVEDMVEVAVEVMVDVMVAKHGHRFPPQSVRISSPFKTPSLQVSSGIGKETGKNE